MAMNCVIIDFLARQVEGLTHLFCKQGGVSFGSLALSRDPARETVGSSRLVHGVGPSYSCEGSHLAQPVGGGLRASPKGSGMV